MPDIKKYEKIVFNHNPKKAILLEALDICKQFIQDNKLILTGGMAIDFALRTKGSRLYDDDTLPDYDFYSPKHYAHAYELSTILCKRFPNCEITVINATHATTMKVRMDFVVIADITYVPQVIFDQIPTLIYQKFIFEHPHAKYINMHLALCLPYNEAPRESSLQRWKKDMTRFDMLYEKFPIVVEQRQASGKVISKVPLKYLEKNCLAGTAAFRYYNGECKVVDGFLEVPGNFITIITEDEKLANQIADKSLKYNAILDQIGHSTIVKTDCTYEILCTDGKLYSATQPFEIDALQNFYVINPQHICAYVLTKHFLFKDDNNRREQINYLALYLKVFELIKAAKHPWIVPYQKVYGQINQSPALQLYRDKLLITYGEKTPDNTVQPNHARPTVQKDCEIPANKMQFDYEKSWVFQTDGQLKKDYEK